LADELKVTSYGKLDSKRLRLPKRKRHYPSSAALTERLKMVS
jgi:hypothetical protein